MYPPLVPPFCSLFSNTAKPIATTHVLSLHCAQFPALSRLAEVTDLEKELRELGFGYRAAFISRTTAAVLARGGSEWLEGLRAEPVETARIELEAMHGVGRKVRPGCARGTFCQPAACSSRTPVYAGRRTQ